MTVSRAEAAAAIEAAAETESAAAAFVTQALLAAALQQPPAIFHQIAICGALYKRDASNIGFIPVMV